MSWVQGMTDETFERVAQTAFVAVLVVGVILYAFASLGVAY